MDNKQKSRTNNSAFVTISNEDIYCKLIDIEGIAKKNTQKIGFLDKMYIGLCGVVSILAGWIFFFVSRK